MTLDEELQRLAERVPAPPPGDAASAFRRGVRRRRWRQGVGVVTTVVAVGVLGFGASSLFDAQPLPDIANRPAASPSSGTDDVGEEDVGPPGRWPVITGAPAAAVSSEEPFPWTVSMSPGEGGRWCATTARGTTEPNDVTGQRCDQIATPDQQGDGDGFGTGGSQLDATPGRPASGLSWGLAPVAADEVVVLFTDGTRRSAELADEATDGGRLWAIGYESTEVQQVEAHTDSGEVIARNPATATQD